MSWSCKREYVLLGLSLLLIIGCSKTEEYAPISGKVFYNEKPLSSGVVMFQPPNGPPARGTIQSDGTFELKTMGQDFGARIGLNKVRVSCRESTAGGGREVGLGKLLTPKRYNDFTTSRLTAEVKAEGNEPFEFHLKD